VSKLRLLVVFVYRYGLGTQDDEDWLPRLGNVSGLSKLWWLSSTNLGLLRPLLDVTALDDAIRIKAAILVHRDDSVDLQAASRTSTAGLALGSRLDSA
jgi:hypothetical protein